MDKGTLNQRSRRGGSMIEFSLVGPIVFAMIFAIMQLSVGMWQYHTLAAAIQEGTRAVVTKGNGCVTGGNSCGTTVGNIATAISTAALGIPSSQLRVTMTTQSGATITCNPLNACFSNATVWPPSSNNDNMPGKVVTIVGTLTLQLLTGIHAFMPNGRNFGTVTAAATSAQAILF